MTANFITFDQAAEYIRGKSIAIVGSAPSVLDNEPGFIDSHDCVVRVNNYKLGFAAGFRCDVYYSFFGGSIRKTVKELQRDGVKLCMNKCPNSKPLESTWHEKHGKQIGIDFRYIYDLRKDFWFCDTFVPDDEHFLRSFDVLGRHIPSTGFAAIMDVVLCDPRSIYLTGFDLFSSGIHNVDEPWRPGRADDPIGHRPDLEAAWIRQMQQCDPIQCDPTLARILGTGQGVRT